MSEPDWTWWSENWQWWIPVFIGAASPAISAGLMIAYDQAKSQYKKRKSRIK